MRINYKLTMDVRLASPSFILTSAIFAMLIFSEMPPLYAQSSLHTDRSGYTTGTIGNNSVSIYHDRYGNASGSIGSKRISTYSDGYGGYDWQQSHNHL
jgi:hypothetical protein